MVAAAVVGGVASLGGAAIQAGAASSAARAQRDAANRAIAAQQGYFDIAQKNLQPFINVGTEAGNKIEQLQGLNGSPSDIQATLETLPGYQFTKYQGLKSTQNSATARGLGLSGAAQKAAASYATGLSNEYYNNFLTGLQNTQATGENAASSLAGNATTTGGNVGENIIGAGNATAAGKLAVGQTFGQLGTSTIPNALIANALYNSQNPAGVSTTNFLASNSPIYSGNSGYYNYNINGVGQ